MTADLRARQLDDLSAPVMNVNSRWWHCVLLGAAVCLASCSDSPAPPKEIVSTPLDLSTVGTIHAEVVYEGQPPAPQLLSLRSAPQCAAAHTEPVYDESLIAPGGHLVNAVVWIKDGMGDRIFAPPKEPVVIDQKGCIYHPHVAAAMVWQPVQFLNSDPEPHNVRGRPHVVKSWNFLISQQNASRTLTFDKPEVAVQVGCDIHPWMQAYLAIVPHPYFAITASSGNVTLEKVPPGDYVVGVWHETLGTKEQRVTVAPQGSADVRFAYSGSR